MSGPGNKGRVYNLNKAIKILHRSPGISVQQTSFLYSSRAKYVLDQPAFINAVCRVEAELEPFDMLHKLKSVEKEVGRTETFRHGPRVLDLDILCTPVFFFLIDEFTSEVILLSFFYKYWSRSE